MRVKIDVEGFEEDLLEGGEVLLADSSRALRLIYPEVHPDNWSLCGTTSDSIIERLPAANYEVRTLDGKSCRSICTYGHVIARRIDEGLCARGSKV